MAALDALQYLITQVKEVRDPLSGIQECFSQAFGDVHLALARREILERLWGTLGGFTAEPATGERGKEGRTVGSTNNAAACR
ncbi:hypothetical protein [Streptomyces klenkii]